MTVEFFQLLLLIIIANAAPILVRLLLKDRFNLAVDFGQKMLDQHRIFGSSKTWRGILASIVATSAVAWLLGYAAKTGLLIAVYAALGDLVSSFIKRRLAMVPSSKAPFLDQVPESFFPAVMMREEFDLDPVATIFLVLIFVIFDLSVSRILFKWGVRKRPY
jgi:CDP-2,3-bis-(O-geranylgeranyl)-sn-glycerol synthase